MHSLHCYIRPCWLSLLAISLVVFFTDSQSARPALSTTTAAAGFERNLLPNQEQCVATDHTIQDPSLTSRRPPRVGPDEQASPGPCHTVIPNGHLGLVFTARDRDSGHEVLLSSGFSGGRLNQIIMPTDHRAWMFDMRVSPDGTHVAYRIAFPSEGWLVRLYAAKLGDSAPPKELSKGLPFFSQYVFDYRWSPDSSSLAFRAGDPIFDYEWVDLYSVRRDGSERARINSQIVDDGGTVFSLYDWSPDSSRIAYLAKQKYQGNIELFSAVLDGHVNRKLNPPLVSETRHGREVALGWVRRFAWSPDSTQIAYIADGLVHNKLDLYAVNANGSRHRLLASGNQPKDGVTSMSWSPYGEWIAFSGKIDTAADTNLYVVSSKDGNTSQVSQYSPANEYSWAPDERGLIYSSPDSINDELSLHFVAPDGTRHIQVATGLSRSFYFGHYLVDFVDHLAWAPDGSRIAYLSEISSDGSIALYTARPESAHVDRVSRLAQTGSSVVGGSTVPAFEWAPDSTRIAYRADVGSGDAVRLFSARPDGTDHAEVTTFPSASMAVSMWKWAPNSRLIAYSALPAQGGDRVLYTVSPKGTGQKLVNQEVSDYENVGATFEWFVQRKTSATQTQAARTGM